MESALDTLGLLTGACRNAYVAEVQKNARLTNRMSMIRKKIIAMQELTDDVSMPGYTSVRINELCRQILLLT